MSRFRPEEKIFAYKSCKTAKARVESVLDECLVFCYDLRKCRRRASFEGSPPLPRTSHYSPGEVAWVSLGANLKPVLLFFLLWAVVPALLATSAALSQQIVGSNVSDFGPEATGPGKGGGSGFGVDYSFKGGTDGAGPTASLIQDPAGNLYGTTSQGGNTDCGGVGCGTVFRVDTRNHETVLHVFTGGTSDGATPHGRLVMDESGNLYGTTSAGGNTGCGGAGCGTVFKIDSSGTEMVLYSFTGSPDGANPYAGPVMDGASELYGTTENGGASNSGTVFKIDTSGNETVLYSFNGGPSDGADPKADLTFDPAGNLYGTTYSGGSFGDGTVFELNTSGVETVLYSFTGGADGGNPFGGVTRDSTGALFGTVENGGSQSLDRQYQAGPEISHGCCRGLVYELNGTGFSVLYTFTGNNDGGNPACDLALNNGVLYGTTLSGGPGHRGTAFSLTIATRSEGVLHGFTGKADGGTPQAGLLMNGAGVLYGTAAGGGKNQKGTVFQYKLK